MMNQYAYLFLGVLLGAAIVTYLWISREEKIENVIKKNQKVFSTPRLDQTMEEIVDKIKYKINEVKRDLTEEEKNEIIENCLQNFMLDKKIPEN